MLVDGVEEIAKEKQENTVDLVFSLAIILDSVVHSQRVSFQSFLNERHDL